MDKSKLDSKLNYSAWNLEPDNFRLCSSQRERLRFLVGFAILAPSTHNSQPWIFEAGEDSVVLRPNLKRKLSVSDPLNRHLYISLGCALENILIAADYYGLKTTVHHLRTEPPDATLAIKIEFAQFTAQKSQPQHLVFAIPRRRTNRQKYLGRPLDPEFVSLINHISSDEVVATLIESQSQRDELAEILVTSRIAAFSNKAFRAEMAGYKRTNFTSSPLGMPGFVMGFGNLFSLIAPLVIKHLNIIKLLKRREGELLKKYTPAFLIMSAKEHNPSGWLATGQTLQRIMLEAERRGIQTAISAIPPDTKPIQDLLNINNLPQIFLRLGYTDKVPMHSPRLQLAEVIES